MSLFAKLKRFRRKRRNSKEAPGLKDDDGHEKNNEILLSAVKSDTLRMNVSVALKNLPAALRYTTSTCYVYYVLEFDDLQVQSSFVRFRLSDTDVEESEHIFVNNNFSASPEGSSPSSSSSKRKESLPKGSPLLDKKTSKKPSQTPSEAPLFIFGKKIENDNNNNNNNNQNVASYSSTKKTEASSSRKKEDRMPPESKQNDVSQRRIPSGLEEDNFSFLIRTNQNGTTSTGADEIRKAMMNDDEKTKQSGNNNKNEKQQQQVSPPPTTASSPSSSRESMTSASLPNYPIQSSSFHPTTTSTTTTSSGAKSVKNSNDEIMENEYDPSFLTVRCWFYLHFPDSTMEFPNGEEVLLGDSILRIPVPQSPGDETRASGLHLQSPFLEFVQEDMEVVRSPRSSNRSSSSSSRMAGRLSSLPHSFGSDYLSSSFASTPPTHHRDSTSSRTDPRFTRDSLRHPSERFPDLSSSIRLGPGSRSSRNTPQGIDPPHISSSGFLSPGRRVSESSVSSTLSSRLAAASNSSHPPSCPVQALFTIHFDAIPELIKAEPNCMEDFNIVKVIGKGYFGKVMMVQWRAIKGPVYALKSIHKVKIHQKASGLARSLAELDVLRTIRHPFVVNLKFSFHTTSKVYYGMPCILGGDFLTNLQESGKFGTQRVRFYGAQIVLALSYLHENKIVYRDLKLENMLLDLNGYLRLADFGLSKKNISQQSMNSMCGSVNYVAPEMVHSDQKYSYEVDWWALGVVLYEMIYGYPPFYRPTTPEVYKAILKAEPELPPTKFVPELRRLILKLLTKNSKQRLGHRGAEEVKAEPFFISTDWEGIYSRQVSHLWKPFIEEVLDVSHFDEEFTRLTPLDSVPLGGSILASSSFQERFHEFDQPRGVDSRPLPESKHPLGALPLSEPPSRSSPRGSPSPLGSPRQNSTHEIPSHKSLTEGPPQPDAPRSVADRLASKLSQLQTERDLHTGSPSDSSGSGESEDHGKSRPSPLVLAREKIPSDRSLSLPMKTSSLRSMDQVSVISRRMDENSDKISETTVTLLSRKKSALSSLLISDSLAERFLSTIHERSSSSYSSNPSSSESDHSDKHDKHPTVPVFLHPSEPLPASHETPLQNIVEEYSIEQEHIIHVSEV